MEIIFFYFYSNNQILCNLRQDKWFPEPGLEMPLPAELSLLVGVLGGNLYIRFLVEDRKFIGSRHISIIQNNLAATL